VLLGTSASQQGPDLGAMDPKYAQYNYSVATVTATAAPEQQSMNNNSSQVPTVIGVAVDPGAGQGSAPSVLSCRNVIPTHQISMDLNKKDMYEGLPPELRAAGMTEATWKVITNAVEDGKRENPFYNCPICECIYWCVPGACLQCCLCFFLNPCSWWIVAKENRGRRAAVEQVSRHLENNCAQWDCQESEGRMETFIVIYPREVP
jgi:hypothetical protein